MRKKILDLIFYFKWGFRKEDIEDEEVFNWFYVYNDDYITKL